MMIRVLTVFLAVLAYLVPPPAYAESDNSVRNRIKIRKRSHLTRPDTEESEQYSLEKMQLLAEKRRSLILDIKRFIREARAEDQKAELNLRLGALFMEDYRGNLAKAQQSFEQQQKEFNSTKNKSQKRAPKFDNSEALGSLDRARAIYKDLVHRFPKHPRRDEMLYFMAVSTIDKGRTQEGMAYFQKLAVETPNSKYLNEALIQLGDHFFEQSQFAVAEGYYDKLIAKKYKPLLPYAVYKKAWCAYNQQRAQQALTHFRWVVLHEDDDQTANASRVKNEALRDLPLVFVDLKMLDEAIAFFRAHGDPHYRRGLETMAGLYSEQGDYARATPLYERLLTMDPTNAKNPSYEIAIVNGLKLKGDAAGAVQRLFARFPNYLENSSWYEIQAGNPQVISEAVKGFEETARSYALQLHAEGQKTKNAQLYNVAKLLYAKYIEFFPRSPQVSQVRFYLAEILYRQEQYAPAADQYFAVYKDPAAGNLRYDSIRYALNALDKQMNIDRRKQGLTEVNLKSTGKLKAKDEESLEALPYSDTEIKFITVSNEYLDKYSTAKDAADVLYEIAYLHYLHHELAKAHKSFWQLVQKYPKHSTAYASASLILDILNRSKEYSKLIAACQKFLMTEGLSRSDFRREVSDVLRKAELKKIQLVEDKGDFKDAADQYIEYTKAYGSQDEALFEKALYNASVNYGKANLFLSAVETQEKFLRRFPRSQLRENLLLQVAKSYETLANFEKAAYYYDLFVSQYPKNAQAKSAFRLAGLYFWGAGNLKRAETTMTQFMRTYPRDWKMAERDLVDLYETSGSTERLTNFYYKARAEKGGSFSDYIAYTLKIAEIYAQKNNGRMPTKLMEEALKIATRYSKDVLASPKGVELASKVFFWAANQKESYFYSLKLALPQAKLEKNLKTKLALIKELERDYNRIVSLGSGEWGLASIYKTAAAYRSMALDIQQAPVPAELSAEQVEQYRAEINRQMVKPFNEKALALAMSCADKSQEFNLLSGWMPRCYSLAGELDPSRYPAVRTFHLPPMQTALMVPVAEQSKIPLGSLKAYAYPYYSTGMFSMSGDRNVAATIDIPLLYDDGHDSSSSSITLPSQLTYRTLADERKEILRSLYEREKPGDLKKGTTFAFLSLLRLTQPQRALSLVLEAIQRDPSNQALHNLLGLTYLELGNRPGAKVTWLSMIARGIKNSSIWNNLGVIAVFEGKETAAIDYFNEATLLEAPREALSNLGFIALKYRNGFDAKKHFEKAVSIEREDVSAQVGLAVGMLQNREIEAAKEALVELSKNFKSDPYSRLSLAYLLIDLEKEHEIAKRVLAEFVEGQNVDSDLQFRQALQEAKTVPTAQGPESLPSVGD